MSCGVGAAVADDYAGGAGERDEFGGGEEIEFLFRDRVEDAH